MKVDSETRRGWRDNRNPQTQVEALGEGMKAMNAYEVPGLFVYQKTGSVWLVEEYLDAHPSIREDVYDYIESSQTSESDDGGLLSRLL
ncbi:hypothetical protein [Halosimplex carlsbadense]|uniref:hypothetical protein n=1 Tax=Halosimplex carlsbadense TaxID=171164 RepID=UPI001267F714|nr:hypothetical protein [Halosimplex carlsbadense]